MVADTMDRIITNVKFPQYRIGQDPTEYYGSVEKTAEELARTGATHIMVNLAVCSIPWTMDPDNSYLRFTEYGYPMNQFVSTTYDQDIYYSKMMQLNRDNLLANAALARKYGLRCYMMCVEPTFMQEKLFARYPHWRGPRVDNPSCSHKPLFAPCVILPEVQDYYRTVSRFKPCSSWFPKSTRFIFLPTTQAPVSAIHRTFMPVLPGTVGSRPRIEPRLSRNNDFRSFPY